MGKEAMKLITRQMIAGVSLVLPLTVLAQQADAAQAGSKWWADSSAKPVAEVVANEPIQDNVTESTSLAPTANLPLIAAGSVGLKDFDCVEVKRFEVFSDFITSKQDARAATIPAEKIGALQREVAGQVPEKVSGLKSTLVAEGSPQCPDPQRTVVLGGRISDFKAGNQALRYLVGFGAGAQKFSVQVRATRKSDGALIGEGEVTDRKVGGWIGGQDDKGMEDFAEKVAGFLKAALQAK